ncbi:uncharacterized protein BDR25DRAFT_77668 [Lindgomyces ingoldianus]|uniref:Uncharacterized protein n=1 Tax=Lindgomyces ingoldianus TaxID=673940 RepID=A0ACB6QH57_9PLEO|nr:uncharacterized protein BDR25DRAFT_77668 [Lindgomyces ingoldianus]KAF2466349.1 hypothetical protein BDR25DRAFT_77668 [Lindgomyces ingoldianus]
MEKDKIRTSNMFPRLEEEIRGLKRNLRIAESDVKHHTAEADQYKNQVYGLQVDLESIEARLSQEIQTLKDKLNLIEGERDALKTNLKEEEVLRIAAEGQIPLPAATSEEHDEFGSPIRSPRKLRANRDDEDKENVAPRKAAVELKFLQQQIISEKRLRERAEEQIDFMKMECQFQCCSCRIADLKGSTFIHDDSYATEMERIKASVPIVTPPQSSHGDDSIRGVPIKQVSVDSHNDDEFENVVIKQEPVNDDNPFASLEQPSESLDHAFDSTGFPKPPVSATEEPSMAFSPTTGTFKAVPSPAKASVSAGTSTPGALPNLDLSLVVETAVESSPWTPEANSTVIRTETACPPPFRPLSRQESLKRPVLSSIVIHEDAVEDELEENSEPLTPLHGPSGPATPGQYLTRTITTTTTIPLHFSPFTPARKEADQPLTPSTIAHTRMHTSSQPLADLSLNTLPFDREAALEQIRQRRGRARSMAAGHGTPRKQMMEGVTERRDISAPVGRVRR